MKYTGSKNRIAKYILPIMLEYRRKDQWWVEPFVGGANMIDKVDGNHIGADSNKWVIQALVFIRDNIDKLPKDNKEFTEQDYLQLKKGGACSYKGYVGFAYSFGAMWFNSWRKDKKGKRDYVAESYRNAVKQNLLLQSVKFITASYQDLIIPKNSMIYCDPPYMNTAKYKGTDYFNHTEFWQWCRDKIKEGHTIFVSEYIAPDDFICIWKKEICSSLAKNTGSKKAVEKLFIHKSQYRSIF